MGAADVIVPILKKEAANWVIKALVAKSSFFAGWLISPILGWVVPMIIDVLYDKGALGVNWLWIIVENKSELKDVIKSKENLRAVLLGGGDYTKAEQEFDDAAEDLIRHNFNHLPR